MDITQEMVDQASAEESSLLSQSPEVLQAQNQHLNQRVILLRALVNEQKKEIESLQEKLDKRPQPRDRRPKKTTQSRPK